MRKWKLLREDGRGEESHGGLEQFCTEGADVAELNLPNVGPTIIVVPVEQQYSIPGVCHYTGFAGTRSRSW